MTDTNYIEVLQRIRDGYFPHGAEQRAALEAAITALSARASAGEGGDAKNLAAMLRGSVIRRLDEFHKAKPDQWCGLLDDATGAAEAIEEKLLTAAPQPAQAGASGGGEHEKMAAYLTQAIKDSEAGKTVYVRLTPGEVEECVTLLRTPASPATGDAATWEEEIRRHDATPPAHGDGETCGDPVCDCNDPDFANATARGESTGDTPTFLETWMKLATRDRAIISAYFREIATRPTPEAHTGTVADIPDADLLCRAVHQLAPRARRQPAWARIADVFALGSTYATQLCRRFGVDPETGKKVDALALPAQGEGNNG